MRLPALCGTGLHCLVTPGGVSEPLEAVMGSIVVSTLAGWPVDVAAGKMVIDVSSSV